MILEVISKMNESMILSFDLKNLGFPFLGKVFINLDEA